MDVLGPDEEDAWVSPTDSGMIRPDKMIPGMHRRRASFSGGYEFAGMITDALITGDSAASPPENSKTTQDMGAVSVGAATQHSTWDESNSSEDRRLRQLTRGNSVWSGRRGASVDGALTRTLGYLLEFDNAGSLQQRLQIASRDTFIPGTLPALAAAMEPSDMALGSESNETAVRRQSADVQHDDLNMVGGGVGSSIVAGGDSNQVTTTPHTMSLAKQFLKRLYQEPDVPEAPNSHQPTYSASTVEQEIMYCAATETMSLGGDAVLSAHQKTCRGGGFVGNQESELINLLKKQPLARTGTGMEGFGFDALMQQGAQSQDSEVLRTS